MIFIGRKALRNPPSSNASIEHNDFWTTWNLLERKYVQTCWKKYVQIVCCIRRSNAWWERILIGTPFTQDLYPILTKWRNKSILIKGFLVDFEPMTINKKWSFFFINCFYPNKTIIKYFLNFIRSKPMSSEFAFKIFKFWIKE